MNVCMYVYIHMLECTSYECVPATVKKRTDYVTMSSILEYNPNKKHKSLSLFNLASALHVSGVTITHLQEHKTTVTTASGNRCVDL
jgi:hypothetical protein